MKQILIIILTSISFSTFCQSEFTNTKWTNGFEIYWASNYNDSIVVFSGGNLHEGGSMFTLKRTNPNIYLLVGRQPDEDYGPSYGEINDIVKLSDIEDTRVLLFYDNSGLLKSSIREMNSRESLEDLMINTKINYELAGKYIDEEENIYIFHPGSQKIDGLTDVNDYTFAYEFDSPIDVIVFKNDQSYFYEITSNGIDLYKAQEIESDYWKKGIKVKSLKKIEWYNFTKNKDLKGKYPFASTEILLESILWVYSKEQLRIMRNEIFARHGYTFRTKAMKEYFGGQKWYKPKYEDVSQKLSELERINIKLIQYQEKE